MNKITQKFKLPTARKWKHKDGGILTINNEVI